MRRDIAILALATCLSACAASEGCPQGTFDCGGICTDLMNDSTNCGGCLNECASG